MFTADQLVAHAVGDYLLQSEWMATEKTKRSLPALVHCLTYVLPFLFLTQNPVTLAVIAGFEYQSRLLVGSGKYKDLEETRMATEASGADIITVAIRRSNIGQNPVTLAVIAGSHFVIDRWHLARYVAWAKNRPWPGSASWSECRQTGFHPDTPRWLSGWLVILVDNIMHILTNGLALYYIG